MRFRAATVRRPGSETTINAEAWYALISGERRGLIPAVARRGLWLASWPYRLGVWWRNRGFERGRRPVFRAAVPVVSVGNLTVGGTGKTPCVEWVARYFREREVRVAILSRGYGAQGGHNDEAMVLEENLPDVPHLQGADRAELAVTAVEELDAELLVLDDGFQHRRLHRDLDVVLIDATRPPTRDYLLPRGTLREPTSGLRRAGVIVLTRCDQVAGPELDAVRAWLAERWPQTPLAPTTHRPLDLVSADGATAPIEALSGAAAGAFCGIGNPVAFWQTLRGAGATLADTRTFPDHHAYTLADVESLRNWAETLPKTAIIATTQKDFVKLRVSELAGRKLWAVRIGLHFLDGEAAVAAALERVRPVRLPEDPAEPDPGDNGLSQ